MKKGNAYNKITREGEVATNTYPIIKYRTLNQLSGDKLGKEESAKCSPRQRRVN